MDIPNKANNKRSREESSSSLSPEATQKNLRLISPVQVINNSDPELTGNIQTAQSNDNPKLESLETSSTIPMPTNSEVNKAPDPLALEEVNSSMEDGEGVDGSEETESITNVTDKHDSLKQKNNRYTNSSLAPFVVFLFDSIDNANLGNLHPAELGRHLKRADIRLNAFLALARIRRLLLSRRVNLLIISLRRESFYSKVAGEPLSLIRVSSESVLFIKFRCIGLRRFFGRDWIPFLRK